MLTWREFDEQQPELAAAGRGLLYQHGVGLAFLATIRGDGRCASTSRRTVRRRAVAILGSVTGSGGCAVRVRPRLVSADEDDRPRRRCAATSGLARAARLDRDGSYDCP